MAQNSKVCETRVYMDAFSNVALSLMNSMNQIPGIMSKMPPLPVSVDERLASYILPRDPMVNVFCFAYDLQSGTLLVVDQYLSY